MRSVPLDVLQYVCGWAYFLSWTASFYPQVILHWKRKSTNCLFSLTSVVGFSFDLLAFNIFGYVAYSAFTVGVYAVPSIQEQYYHKYPGSSLSVMLNDVFFAVHGVLIGLVTCVQIAIYERNDQSISRTCAAVLSLTFLYCVIKSILLVVNVITALDFLTDLSYVKVFITVVKYIPQVFLNYKLRSTVGWSIGNVLLDFSGGILSILQMLILAYNFSDWNQITGSLGKLGLALVTILFDTIFMVQHWCLYLPHREETPRNSFDLPLERRKLIDEQSLPNQLTDSQK
ncbi:Cystinosin lysosomal cystine transporter [Paragonimus heterotremus]|uniref:Cystinosin lysosomal cystine transporter n=1 Tax=Paragonimus heterotremus TaxID=100268 RepID=A0A8J4TQB2_9TREM|nr:Cystinosin lysosomal cystine transporter [Paragonimus heterotremus]